MISSDSSNNTASLSLSGYTFDKPIFVLGITKRSGTNYLQELLCLHEQCHLPGPIWEDSLLEHAELLKWYIRSTRNRWNRDWKVDERLGSSELLGKHIGDGLITFLHEQFFRKDKDFSDSILSPAVRPIRMLTKTPSVENLSLFSKLFPQAQLLIIIRDGRAVTESAVKSFNKPYEIAMREWDQAARFILDFEKNDTQDKKIYRIVRYEALQANPQETMSDILAFLELDEAYYNFEGIESVPVKGSSELTKTGHLHWKATQKTKDFDPTKRWKDWSTWQHARFNWVVGKRQQHLGYSCQKTPIFYGPFNLLLDIFWRPVWPLWRVARKLKYMLGW